MNATSEIFEVIQTCEKEISICDSRIEAGEDVLQLCNDQMKMLKKKKDFFANIKRLMLQGKYHEADKHIQIKINEE